MRSGSLSGPRGIQELLARGDLTGRQIAELADCGESEVSRVRNGKLGGEWQKLRKQTIACTMYDLDKTPEEISQYLYSLQLDTHVDKVVELLEETGRRCAHGVLGRLRALKDQTRTKTNGNPELAADS